MRQIKDMDADSAAREPDPAARREFLARRQAICRHRMDTLWAPVYDERWGASCSPAHTEFVARLLEATPPGAELLDAACGTGKYWPQLLAAGRRVLGVDQSAGMLARASAKHPDVPVRQLALQDFAGVPELRARFPGLLCVDAMENIGPEDWPGVLAGFRAVLQPGGSAYLSVELPSDADDPREAGAPALDQDPDARAAPLVPGEVLSAGSGYHYYPDLASVRGWLAAAGFTVVADEPGDGYQQFLTRLGGAPG
jgi:SAM-dependent methyltransferase